MSNATNVKKKTLNTMKINLTLSDFRKNNTKNYQLQPLFETISTSDLNNGKINNNNLCLGIDSPLSLMEKDIETGMSPLHLILLSSNIDLDNIKYLLETYRRYAEEELRKDLLKLQNERNNSIMEIREKFLRSTPKIFKGRSKIQEVTLSMIAQDLQGRKIINSLKLWFKREVERRKRQTEFRIEIFWQKLLSSKDNEGRTPIHYSVSLGKSKSVLEMLLTTGRGNFDDKKNNDNQPLFNAAALFEVSTGREVASIDDDINDNKNEFSMSFAEPKTNDSTIQSKKTKHIDSYGVQVGLRTVLWDLPCNDNHPLFNSSDNNNQFVDYEIIVPWVLRNIIKRSAEMGAKSGKSGLDIVEDLINLIDYNNSKVLILPEVKLLLNLLNIRVTNDVLKELCRMYPTSSDIIKNKWDDVYENQLSLKKQKNKILNKSFNMNDDDFDAKSDKRSNRDNYMLYSDSKQTSYDRNDDSKNNLSSKGGDNDDDRYEDKDNQNHSKTLKLTSATTIKMKDIKDVIFDMETVGDKDFGLNLTNFMKDLQNGKGLRQNTNKSTLISSSIHSDSKPESNNINDLTNNLDDNLLIVPKKKIELEVGLQIEGNFKSLGEWLPGKLGKRYEDGSFDIIYENGENEEQVNKECIRLINIEIIKELDDKTIIDKSLNNDEDDVDLTDMLDEIITKKNQKKLNYNYSPKSNSNNIPGLISLSSIKNSRENVINICDKEGRTCLYYAASFGRKDQVLLILTHGGDVSISTHEGKTPFDASTNSSINSILQASLVNWLNKKELFSSSKRMDNYEKNKIKLDEKLFSGDEDDILLELESPFESSSNGRAKKIIDLHVSMKYLTDNHWSYSRSPLSWAVTNALLPAVKEILKSGADPNSKDTVGKTPLHECLALASPYSTESLADSSLDIAELLMNNGALLNSFSMSGRTPLHELFCKGQDDSTCSFSKITAQSSTGEEISSSHYSTAKSVNKVALSLYRRLLLRHMLQWGANAYLQDRSGLAPIHYCARENMADCMVEILRSDTIKCNESPLTSMGQTPLHIACKAGSAKVAHLLCRWDADYKTGESIINIKDIQGKLAIQLLPKNTSPKVFDNIWSVCRCGNLSRLNMIIEKIKLVGDAVWEDVENTEINIDENEMSSNNYLDKDIDKDKISTKTSPELWLLNGMDTKTRRSRWSPLHACIVGWAEIEGIKGIGISKFTTSRNKINESARLALGLKPTSISSANDIKILVNLISNSHQSYHREIANILLQNNAFIDSLDINCRTPLMLAAAANLTDAIVLLIEAGAFINSKDLDGNTALAFAYMYGSTDAIKLLESNGADSNLTNNSGRIPLEEAGRRLKAKTIFF